MLESIKPLAWDSHFFGKRIGRLDVQADGLSRPLQFADLQRYEIVYVYSPIAIEASLVGQYSVHDVGGHIVLAADLSGHRSSGTKLTSEISEYRHNKPTAELLEIAFLSGHLSRFKVDPSLPVGSFERLYETWLAKTLENRPKTAIYTYQTGGRIAALISTEWHFSKCKIGLLGVADLYQGRGIATSLIKYVKDICVANKVYSIEVKTQLTNTRARSLYAKNSFTEQDRTFIYHAHSIRQP